ncbi:hypothetical protein PWY87_22185 [Kribbella solani]|uniref:hypothetical protein n=1 Tax=Kribbella solani TaxID=236067 RepID=UPI0029AB9738|nr:hypothetical protein [Kribbella solani]MDX2972576.1 hypothetical protein [Kribbella solani]MDX3004414.1 hypothetical protein [Kribbella solani]
MKLQRFALALAGAGLLAAAAASVPVTANAKTGPKPYFETKTANPNSAKASAAEPCESAVGVPTAAGTMQEIYVLPGRTPKAEALEPYNYVGSRANATWYGAVNAAGTQFYYYGLLLQGANLYRHTTYLPADETASPRPTFKKVGSGWSSFKSIATSNYSVAGPRHQYLYGLNTNGSLYRYAIAGAGFKALGPLPGFRGFKAMTVVSETATYDTLLMTTNAGALYTVHIPVAAGAKPVLKLIRSSGWSAYESLVVQGCGTRGGSLIVAVDHDTKAGYQFAMSKANGSKTAITSYGKIPGVVFTGVSHVSLTTHYDQLVGE